ncbi:MAG: hypothetical protein WCO84_00635 [bacterium]
MPEYTVKFGYDIGFDRWREDGVLNFPANDLEDAKKILNEREGSTLAPQMRGVHFDMESLKVKETTTS